MFEGTATPEKSQQYHKIETQRRTETARDIREYGPETHKVAGTQTRPPVSFDILRQQVRSKGKPQPKSQPKPPTSTPKPSPYLNRVRTESLMVPTPGIGTLQGGGYRVDMDPMGTGASIMLP